MVENKIERNSEIDKLPSNHLCWYVTERCNYDCDICFRYKEGREELSKENAFCVIDKTSKLGISKITFTGEPLLVGWIPQVVDYAKKLGMFTTLMTNGSLLTEDMANIFAKSLDRLSLPIDGSTDEMNTKMTRPPGHLENVFRIFRQFTGTSLKLKVSTAATRVNLQDLVATAEIVKLLKVDEWKIEQFRPNRGNAIINRERFEIDAFEFIKVAEKCRNACIGTNIKVSFTSLNDRYDDFFLMKPNGDLEVSTGDKYHSLGNVLNSELHTILDSYRTVNSI